MTRLCTKCNITYNNKVNYCVDCGSLLQIKTCHRCNETLNENYKFCPNCGLKLRFFCPKCKQEYIEGQSECYRCNMKFSTSIPENEVYNTIINKEGQPVITDDNNNEKRSKDIKENTNINNDVFVEPKNNTQPDKDEKPIILDDFIISKPVIIQPNIKAQLENHVRHTELNLQMLKWLYEPLSFRNDNFLADIKDTMSTNIYQKKIKKPWDKYLQFHRRGDYFRSAEELNRILRVLPDNLDVLINLAICHRRMGDIKKVFDFLIRSKFVKPDDKGVLNELIGTSSQLRYWKTFMDALRAYYAIAKREDDQSHYLFEYELRFGFFQNALDTLKDLLSLDQYSLPSSIREYLTLMALRCLDDKTYSKFHMLISNESFEIRDSLLLLESKVINKETPDYRASQSGEKEALYISKKKENEIKSNILLEQCQSYFKEGKLEDARKVCIQLEKLLEEGKEANHYFFECQLLEVERMMNTGDDYNYRTAQDLCWKIPVKYRPDRWKEINEQIKLKQRSRRVAKVIKTTDIDIQNKKDVNRIMKEAHNLAQNNPKAAILLINKRKALFSILKDSIRMNNLLGHCYMKTNQFDEALKSYQFVYNNATQIQQKIGSLYSHAFIFNKKTDYQEAINSLERIISLDQSRRNHIEPMIDNTRQRLSAALKNDVKISETDERFDMELLNNSRLYSLGAPVDEISDFLNFDIKEAEIEELGQRKIESKQFKVGDIEYLQKRAKTLARENKPKLAAKHYMSAVKVLYNLNRENDEAVIRNLARFCATKADAYVIEKTNWDIARTYYAEMFRFSTSFYYPDSGIFDKKQKLDRVSEINFSKFLSTYHRSKKAFLDQSIWAIYNLKDIFNRDDRRIIEPVLKGLILLASYNSEICRYILFLAKHDKTIYDNFCHYFSKIFNKTAEKNDYNFLEEIIDHGVSKINELTLTQKSQFQFFNSNSFAQIIEKKPSFLDWNIPFHDLGVDHTGTDSRYFEKMKMILREIDNYDSVEFFDDRESKYLTALKYITDLVNNIVNSPTYWSRTYMLPLVEKWKVLLEKDFKKRDDQASPILSIEYIERVELMIHEHAEIHISVANKGTRNASGVKLQILPSTEDTYITVQKNYEIGSIRIEESVTRIIQIAPCTDEERLALNYQIAYDRKGKEMTEEVRSIPVSLHVETFEPFHNPYMTWAQSSIVTDVKMFIGRNAFVDDIVDILKNVGKNKTIVIHGQKRSGKSSILYHVARKIENDLNFLPIEMDLGSIRPKSEETFFHAILLQLKSMLPNAPEIPLLSINPTLIFINYIRKLNTLPEMSGKTPLLIIDEFTYLYKMINDGDLDKNFMLTWKSIFEKHLFAILLAGTDDMSNFMKENANAFASTSPKYVGYLDDKGANELIVKPIFDKTKNTSRLQKNAINEMIQLTAGNPFYIQILMDKLVLYMNKNKINRATVADINKVVEDYIVNLQLSEAIPLFDNLTSFLSIENEETKLEKRILQILAHITTSQEFADERSILQEFGNNEHENVKAIIEKLSHRNVLVSRKGFIAYQIQVKLFKFWLNIKMPYERKSAIKNPYIVGNPVTGEQFYGRQQDIEKILQNISDKSYLLDAQWRTGKTSFLFKIQQQLKLIQSDFYYIPIFISIDGCREDELWLRIFEGFINDLINHDELQVYNFSNISPSENSKYSYRHFKKEILGIIEHVNIFLHKKYPTKKAKFVIQIDEAQNINDYSSKTKSDLRTFFSQELTIKPYISSIFSGFEIDKDAQSGSSPWTNFLVSINFDSLSDNDFYSLIKDQLKQLYGERFKFEPSAIDKISRYSRKIPYDTQVYCNMAFEEIISKEESIITDDIIETIKSKAREQINSATNGLRGDLDE